MKIMFILVVLLMSLFVLAGAAFAFTPCIDACPGYPACYKVTGTDLNNPANSFVQDWDFCFSYQSDSLGYLCEGSGTNFLFYFSFFYQGLIDQAISTPGGSSTRGGYMTFHGTDDNIFNGLYYDEVSQNQYKIHGVAQECEE
jgi:hypothetical protein